MSRRGEVRIPPKRLHLLGVFCGSLLLVLLLIPFVLFGLLPSLGQDPSIIQVVFTALVVLCCIITTLFMALSALWALVRLVFNLPALILTPDGIVNHSIIYHVVLPWREIDEFVRYLPTAAPSAPRDTRRRYKQLGATILVLEHDQRRLCQQQQPLTRALLWAFSSLIPTNINTEYMAWSRDEVWTELERYARETVGATQIKFGDIGQKSSGRS